MENTYHRLPFESLWLFSIDPGNGHFLVELRFQPAIRQGLCSFWWRVKIKLSNIEESITVKMLRSSFYCCWWFGTFIFSILGTIIPFDFQIFQTDWTTNHFHITIILFIYYYYNYHHYYHITIITIIIVITITIVLLHYIEKHIINAEEFILLLQELQGSSLHVATRYLSEDVWRLRLRLHIYHIYLYLNAHNIYIYIYIDRCF